MKNSTITTTSVAAPRAGTRVMLSLDRDFESMAQIGRCNFAQNAQSTGFFSAYRMLKKAFKGLGLKLGYIPEMYNNQSVIKISETTKWSVRYYRNTGIQIETHEISFEDLFDAEVRDGACF